MLELWITKQISIQKFLSCQELDEIPLQPMTLNGKAQSASDSQFFVIVTIVSFPH